MLCGTEGVEMNHILFLPVNGATGPIWLRAITAKTKHWERGPEESVCPQKSKGQRHMLPLNPLTCKTARLRKP